MTGALWAVLAAAAMLWPSHLAGPLDGAPLDRPLEAVLIGLLFVWLVVADRRFLYRTSVRGLIIALLSWKAATSAALEQDGWCVRFTAPAPIYRDGVVVPHTWDVRADWRAPVPRCSAVMTYGYPTDDHFPTWFLNLPPADVGRQATAADRPPNITLRLDVDGYLDLATQGTLRVLLGPDMRVAARVDAMDVAPDAIGAGVPLAAGRHRIELAGDLTGDRWSLVPLWNGKDVFSTAMPTLTPASTLHRWVRPWGRLVPAMFVMSLLSIAGWSVIARVGSPLVMGLAVALAAIMAAVAASGREGAMRVSPLLLLAVGAVRLPRRVQNVLGVSILIGVPFLALFIARGAPGVGMFSWYSSGDDWWTFQRFAYRIFLQGYWLEGGERTFWFQPLYRWIAGSLHVIFGDSSVGELFWDAGCVLTGAVFAFHVTRSFAGFRAGVLAAVTTLATFTLGPAWHLFGRGLSEFTSAGFLYGAALLAMRGRHRSWPIIALAGAVATLSFYTRLNNLPMALAIAVFAWPVRMPVGRIWMPATLWPSASKAVVAGVLSAIAVGLHLFTLRTWHYTSVYNMFLGSSASVNTVWKVGESLGESLASSVLMVLTMNDPPRFDVRAIPTLVGFVAALLGVVRVGRFARLPMSLVLFSLAGISSALVARGSTYPGRFSIHMIPATVALAVCAASLFIGEQGGPTGSRSTPPVPRSPATR